VEIGYPDMRAQPVLGSRNLANLALILAVPIPGILVTVWMFSYFGAGAIPPDPHWAGIRDTQTAVAYLLHHPILSVNLIYFVNVCLLFWIIALVQRSSWLIDPYWTLIPLLINGFYFAHPLASASNPRSTLTWLLLLAWSVRLTHNYLRREQWRLGFREDWRFAERRAESRHFWWFQLFYVYVAQQPMLVGLTLPFFAIHWRHAPLGPFDVVFAALALAGLGIAHLADASLDRFMRANAERVARGEAKQPLLDAGIWRWSRHPNYFGEQLFWWAIAGYGVVLGVPWVAVGTALNTAALAVVTVMTERRMLADPTRTEAFLAYRERTPVWLPWPPSRSRRRISEGLRRRDP